MTFCEINLSAIHFYALVTWLEVTVVLIILWAVSFTISGRLFRQLKHIYHLSVISYWLKRLEAEGTHCFQRPDKEELEIKDE